MFEANGKVGEQITDVAADVMVKIATKIGMSPEEQVKCSVEAAKAGPKPALGCRCGKTKDVGNCGQKTKKDVTLQNLSILPKLIVYNSVQ